MHRVAILSLSLLLSHCQSLPKELPYGRRAEYSGFVPARTAVLPCQIYPHTARFESLPLSNIATSDLQKMCDSIDAFVIKSFRGQPHMRGFSPQGISKLLGDEFNSAIDFHSTWNLDSGVCAECRNIAAFYLRSIQDRPLWREWLKGFSKKVRNADALLLPFITYANEERVIDRGFVVKERRAEAVLLLVYVENGFLIWSGGRSTFAREQMRKPSDKEPDFPPWQIVEDRLLVEDLWFEYPGRQVLGED
jgi:hypothetical protein